MTESKKPSDRLNEIIAAFPKQEPGTIRFPLLEALPVYLDAEHERRAAFEKGVFGRLDILERSQRDVLTRLPVVDHSALTGLIGDGAPPYEVPDWIERAKPVLCLARMPDAEIRVLFFVPSEPRDRWRTGHYDNTARAPRWWDDFTSAGDEPVLYSPEQVTHWMPMPGEPAV